MKNIISSDTNDLSLAEVITQISQHDAVLGIMQIGSLKRKQISPHSDYDLVFILAEAIRSWCVGITYIDNRFTDLIFVDSAEIQRIVELEAPVTHDHELVPMLRWLRDGEILYARSPTIQLAQEKVRTQNWIEPSNAEAAYGAWYHINFNLVHLKRMLSANDPLYQQTVAIRMAVYGHSDIWFGYFTIRGIEFLGDKAAIRYLWDHDPEFLSAYQNFIQSKNADEKFVAYETAASLATAPLGGLWPEKSTVMNVADTLEIWQRLLGAEQLEQSAP